MHMCGLCHCMNLAGASVFVSVCCGLLRSDGIFTCHGVFSMSWRFMFCLHIMACLFTCHGGSYFVYMSWWFMLFVCHVFFSCHGSSCCSCVMVFFHVMAVHVHVPSCFVHVVVVHVVHLSRCFLKS